MRAAWSQERVLGFWLLHAYTLQHNALYILGTAAQLGSALTVLPIKGSRVAHLTDL